MEAGDYIAIGGAVVAVAGVWLAFRQLRRNEKTTRAQMYLTLREMFSKHEEVHKNLRPGGIWTKGKGPNNEETEMARAAAWIIVESYMGLFEHCNRMIADGLLDLRSFKISYGYRVKNILKNHQIAYTKLVTFRRDWCEFIDLCVRLGYQNRFPLEVYEYRKPSKRRLGIFKNSTKEEEDSRDMDKNSS
jgi:hypothetical protein